MTTKTPTFKLKDRGLLVTVWANQNKEDQTFYSTTLIKSYKDGDDWKETNSMSEGDLLRASRLLQKAYDNILDLKAK